MFISTAYTVGGGGGKGYSPLPLPILPKVKNITEKKTSFKIDFSQKHSFFGRGRGLASILPTILPSQE